MHEWLRKIGNGILCLITLVSVIFAVIFGREQYVKRETNREMKAALEAEVDTIRRDIETVRRDRARFNTSPHFVEQLARANRLSAENEIVFVFE